MSQNMYGYCFTSQAGTLEIANIDVFMTLQNASVQLNYTIKHIYNTSINIHIT